MAIRRWAVMFVTAVCLAGDGARTIVSAQVAEGDGSAQAAQGDGTTPQEPAKPETIPVPEHTGFGALFHSTISDFASFPRRKSTWVILGIGAGAAAIAYPFDDDINEALQDADALRQVSSSPASSSGTRGSRAALQSVSTSYGRYAMEPVDRHPHQQGVASRLRSPSRQPCDAGTDLRDQGRSGATARPASVARFRRAMHQ